MSFKNIEIIRTSGGVTLDFSDESVDVVLLYDVLHYLEKIERVTLYGDVFRILKQHGFLSVYPKHVLNDSPLNAFDQLHLDDVKREIKASGFRFHKKYCYEISHDDFLNQGCVFNFIKGFYSIPDIG